MTHQIVLRDVARIVLPFSVFVGIFGHSTVSVAGFAVCAICVWSEIRNGLEAAAAANEMESG